MTASEFFITIQAIVESWNWTVDPSATPPPPIADSFTAEVPRRTHRRSRIRKKWEKCYGTRTVKVRMRVLTLGKP